MCLFGAQGMFLMSKGSAFDLSLQFYPRALNLVANMDAVHLLLASCCKLCYWVFIPALACCKHTRSPGRPLIILFHTIAVVCCERSNTHGRRQPTDRLEQRHQTLQHPWRRTVGCEATAYQVSTLHPPILALRMGMNASQWALVPRWAVLCNRRSMAYVGGVASGARVNLTGPIYAGNVSSGTCQAQQLHYQGSLQQSAWSQCSCLVMHFCAGNRVFD
jgi:hypothetical protein